jgi:nucleotide-binding universal stress UspA family protein
MKIIIGVDDSSYSQAAMEWVKKVGWPRGSEFFVLSVARSSVMVYATPDGGGAYAADMLEDELKRHRDIASGYERELRELGFATTGVVVQGDPRDVLVTLATQKHADLVVIGSHGRSGVGKLLLGSVAHHVITHAPCSVMVVKPPRRI